MGESEERKHVDLYMIFHGGMTEEAREQLKNYDRFIVEGYRRTKKDRKTGLKDECLDFFDKQRKDRTKKVIYVENMDEFGININYPEPPLEEVMNSYLVISEICKAHEIIKNIQGGEAIVTSELVHQAIIGLLPYYSISYEVKYIKSWPDRYVKHLRNGTKAKVESLIESNSLQDFIEKFCPKCEIVTQ